MVYNESYQNEIKYNAFQSLKENYVYFKIKRKFYIFLKIFKENQYIYIFINLPPLDKEIELVGVDSSGRIIRSLRFHLLLSLCQGVLLV